jgi:hypothetical protein
VCGMPQNDDGDMKVPRQNAVGVDNWTDDPAVLT